MYPVGADLPGAALGRVMAFYWQNFLDRHGIPYSHSGGSANVHMQCPFCGTGSHQAMSISLAGHGWHCWRNDEHRGRSPVKLVQQLLHTSYHDACAIVGVTGATIPGDLMGAVAGLIGPPPEAPPRQLDLLPEFKSFVPRRISARPYVSYLRGPSRGFTDQQIDDMDRLYGLRYCERGPFRGRVIIPIRYNKELVSWTGRAVSTSVELRYRTLSHEAEIAHRTGLPRAVGPANDYLLFHDEVLASDADTLLLVEGPFDALKIMMLGRRLGVVATCFFTMTPTDHQLGLLHRLVRRFKRRALLLDAGMSTLPQALRIQSQLSSLNVGIEQLPHGIKDPGLLRMQHMPRFIEHRA